MEKIIFFGNGPLADYVKATLAPYFEIIFHARRKEDLETVKTIKKSHPDAHGVLASFGVMIKQDILDIFEPEGILNIHPSLLPKYRGSSPIETAILNGDQNFGVSIMNLVLAMDAGPIYYQTILPVSTELNYNNPDLKFTLYQKLAKTGANWLVENLKHLPQPTHQNDSKATFTQKFDTTMSLLDPIKNTADELSRQVLAFQKFPKSKFDFYKKSCIILTAHTSDTSTPVAIKCKDGRYLCIDRLQPAGKKPMDAKSFLNGYAKN